MAIRTLYLLFRTQGVVQKITYCPGVRLPRKWTVRDHISMWVHARKAARFVQSYKRIPSEFQIPGRDDPNADVLQLVRDWLEAKYECRWLMIVDNVDDRNMFFETFTYAGKALRE